MIDIYRSPIVMGKIRVMLEIEEDLYSDIPRWNGTYIHSTESAVLMQIGDKQVWLPFSQLRKTDDGLTIYATNWIIDEKGL